MRKPARIEQAGSRLPKRTFLGCVAFAFISGIGIGWHMSDKSPSPVGVISKITAGAMPGSTTDITGDTSDSQLQARVLELEKALTAQRKELDAKTLADRLDFLTRHPPEKFHSLDSDSVFEIYEPHKINPAMADILELTPEEQQAVEQHVMEIQGEIRHLEDERMTVLKTTDGDIVYLIPTYPEGAQTKAKLYDLLSADIGVDRAELFINNSWWSPKSNMSNFGEDAKTIEISWADQDPNKPRQGRYQIAETYTKLDRNINLIVGNHTDTLPERYQKLLPASAAP